MLVLVVESRRVDETPDDIETRKVKELVNPDVGWSRVDPVSKELANLHRLCLNVMLQGVSPEPKLLQCLHCKFPLFPP